LGHFFVVRLRRAIEQLAGMASLVASGGSGGSSRERLPSPIRVRTAETVETASDDGPISGGQVKSPE